MTADNCDFAAVLQHEGVYDNPVLIKGVVKILVAQLRDLTQDHTEEKNALNKKVNDLEEKLTLAIKETWILRDEKARLTKANLKYFHEEAELQKRNENLYNTAEDFRKSLVSKQEEVQKRNTEIRDLQTSIEEKAEDADQQNKEKRKAQNELQSVKRDYDALNERYVDCRATNARLLKDIEEKKAANKNLQEQLYQSKKEVLTYQTFNSTQQTNNANNCEEERNKLMQENSSLINEIKDLQSKFNTLKAKYKEVLSKRENDQNSFIQHLLEGSPVNSEDDPNGIYSCIDEENYIPHAQTIPKRLNSVPVYVRIADIRRQRNISRGLPDPPQTASHYDSRVPTAEEEQRLEVPERVRQISQVETSSSSEDLCASEFTPRPHTPTDRLPEDSVHDPPGSRKTSSLFSSHIKQKSKEIKEKVTGKKKRSADKDRKYVTNTL